MAQFAINIDWLQVYCHDLNDGHLGMLYNTQQTDYQFILQEHSSRHFRELWTVQNSDGDDYAIIQRVPFSSILSKDGAIIQLCNRELYKHGYSMVFLNFLERFGFKYKSVSRIDICHDSNLLANGYAHRQLIADLFDKKVLKNNLSKMQWNMTGAGSSADPYNINSVKWGSLKSSVSVKMYNKTLEMKEVKTKPYIIQNWAHNGIDTETDVWRIEISIKSDSSTTVRTDTGEIWRLSADGLHTQSLTEEVFFAYAAKYFAFKINSGKKNKTRMEDLKIFEKSDKPTLRPIKITNESDSGRSDKVFLKKLVSLKKELRDLSDEDLAAIRRVAGIFALRKRLVAYMVNVQKNL